MDYLHKLAYPELKEYLSNPNSFIENTIHKGVIYDDHMKPSKRDINIVAKPQSEEKVNVNMNINACCHFCQREETANETLIIKCAFPNCNEAFCYECYEQTTEINGLSEQFQDSKNNKKYIYYSLNNNCLIYRWRCFKCRHLCKCTKCRYFNRKKRRNSKKKRYQSSLYYHRKSTNNNLNKIVIQIPFDNIDIDEHIQPQNVYVNGFNVIELEEEREKSFVLSNNDLKNVTVNKKELFHLFSVRKKCEEFYYDIHGDCVLNIKCLKCDDECFYSNELLYFAERKDLINYIKYCFCFLRKVIFVNMNVYTDNSYALKKYDNAYFKNWKFEFGKTICKMCFMEIMNMKNLFIYLQNIFSDTIPSMFINNNSSNNNNINDNQIRIRRVKEGMVHKKKKKLRLKELNEQKYNYNYHLNYDNEYNNSNIKSKIIYDNVNNTIIIFKKDLVGLYNNSNSNITNVNNVNQIQDEHDVDDNDIIKEQKTTSYLKIKTNNKKKVKSNNIINTNNNDNNKIYTNIINNEIVSQENIQNDNSDKDNINSDLIENEDNKNSIILQNKSDSQLSQINEPNNIQYQTNESNESYEPSEIDIEQEYQNTVFITNKHLMCLICLSNNLLNGAKKLLMLASVQTSQDKFEQIQALNLQMCTEFRNYIDAYEKMYFRNIYRLYSYWQVQNINKEEIFKLFLQLKQIFEEGKSISMDAYSTYCLFYSIADSMNRQKLTK